MREFWNGEIPVGPWGNFPIFGIRWEGGCGRHIWCIIPPLLAVIGIELDSSLVIGVKSRGTNVIWAKIWSWGQILARWV